MRDKATLEKEIASVEAESYYVEYAELFSLVRHFADHVAEGERETYADIIWSRLQSECSAFNAMLCSTVNLPASAPILIEALSVEKQDPQVLKAIMSALLRYPDDESYRAVARYIDSAIFADALVFAARLDFERTLPHLAAALGRGSCDSVCLQVIKERLDEVGIDRLMDELESFAVDRDNPLLRLKDLLVDPRGYCPFSEEQRSFLLRGLGLSYE